MTTNSPPAPRCEGTAARIRNFRVRAGMSREAAAERLGMNPAWYADLEQRDEELAASLTLFQGHALAAILGVQLSDLVGTPAAPGQRVPLIELPQHIRAHLARGGRSLGALEDEIGWELSPLLDSPFKAAAELPIAFFQAISAALAIDWLALIPEAPAA